jgi:hypothetical protein
MKLPNIPITNCLYNQIGFPWLSNENTYFINDSFSTGELACKPHFMFSLMNLKVPQCSSFGVYHNNAPHERFIQRCQNASNYLIETHGKE